MDQDASLFSRLSGDSRLLSLVDDPRPAIVWRGDGRAIVWSNTAGARLLGLALSDLAGNGAALSAATLAPQIAETARRLTSPNAIRLERLRFPGPGRLEAIACSCRRLTLGDAETFVLVIALSEPLWLRGTSPRSMMPPLAPEAIAPATGAPADASRESSMNGSSAEERSPGDGTATWHWSREEPRPSQNETPAPAPPRLPARFVFQMDADGRYTSLSPELYSVIGDGAGRWIGQPATEVGTMSDETRSRLARAIADHAGFTRQMVEWVDPVVGVVTAIELNAAPGRDPEGRSTGFRGFGICRTRHPMAVVATAPEQPTAIRQPISLSSDPLSTAASTDSRVESSRRILAALAQALHPKPSEAGRRANPPPPSADDDDDVRSEPPSTGQDANPRVVAFPEPRPEADQKVITLRAVPSPGEPVVLSPSERSAFREIARALGARIEGDVGQPSQPPALATPTDEVAWAEDAAAEAAKSVDPIRAMREKFRRDDGADAVVSNGDPVPESEIPTEPTIESVEVIVNEPVAADDEPEAEGLAQPRLNGDATIAEVEALQLLDKLAVNLLVVRGEKAVFANRTLLDLAGYEDLEAFERAGGVAKLFTGEGVTGAKGQTQLLLATSRGEMIAVDGRMQLIDWQGQPAQLFTLRLPIEEESLSRLRRSESEAAAATRRADELQAVLDTATDGVVIVDGEGAIIGINRSAEALFGVEATEVAGESFVILIAPESHRSAIDYLDGLRRNGVASVLNDGREIIGRVRQGGRVPLFMTMGRLGDGDRFCAVLRDITQFKKAEQELLAAKRQAEEASSHKSDFLAKVSHEIRTPLNAIIGFAEVMMEERFGSIGNERYRSYMRDIHSAGEHVMGLVNDLLDLAKIEAGRLELTFAAIALNDIIEQCVAIMQPQANRERILIRTSLSRTLPNIVADARTIRQVVLNLLSNSIKFTPKGGQVIVSTTLNDSGEAVMRVRDTGIGMSDKELSVALEPFGQVQSSQNGGGTGLGLPLTKALVEANRATFVIQSAKNNGTLVEVIFPPTRVLAE
jgi:PAS domain S-box-containing protein